jgi:hypothetical protein
MGRPNTRPSGGGVWEGLEVVGRILIPLWAGSSDRVAVVVVVEVVVEEVVSEGSWVRAEG